MIDLTHPSWLTALGTAGGYLIILGIMTLLLFLLPYALFVSL